VVPIEVGPGEITGYPWRRPVECQGAVTSGEVEGQEIHPQDTEEDGQAISPAAVVVVAAVVSLVVLPSLVASHLGIRIGLGGQRIERGLETQDGEKANQGVDQGLEVIPSLLLDPVLDPGPGLGLQ